MASRPTKTELQSLFDAGQPRRPEDVVGVWVWRISLAYQRRAEMTLREFGISHLQFVILITCAWLNLSTERVSQRDLAAEIGVQEAQLSLMVKALKAKKLVMQRPDKTDPRVRVIELSSAGLQILARVLPHMRRFQAELWPSESQNEQLTGIIRTVLQRWGE